MDYYRRVCGMRTGSLLVDAGIAGVIAGVLMVVACRGRRPLLPLALFCLANLAAGAGNMLGGDRWLGAGNLIASVYFAGLWWRDRRDRVAGDPLWLREAMAADRAQRERRLHEQELHTQELHTQELREQELRTQQLETASLGQSRSRSAAGS
jgi:hypothetical protein